MAHLRPGMAGLVGGIPMLHALRSWTPNAVADVWFQGAASYLEGSKPSTCTQAWQPHWTPGACTDLNQHHPAWDLDFLHEKQQAAGVKLKSSWDVPVYSLIK